MKKKHACFARTLLFALLAIFVLSACVSTKTDDDERTAEEILSAMTTEEKVAQLFVISPAQLDLTITDENETFSVEKTYTALTAEMKETLRAYPVGGFILFAQNIENKKQLKKLNADLAKMCEIAPILSVDEEGGRVARLAKTASLGIYNIEEMGAIGASGDTKKAQKAGAYIGGYLREYGFTMDFAPVADVNTNPENIVIGTRSFGSDPILVAQMDGAFLTGLHSAGIKGCLKHFPGHGDTKGDTHADYVSVTKTWEEIADCELIPFTQNFFAADSVMVAHVTFTNVDDEYPASLSKKLITEKLRGELGYTGIILTDALNMGAIEKNYGSALAAILAFEAGNDILLMPKNFVAAYDAVLEAVRTGRISAERLDESVLRILTLKGY